MQLKKGLRVVRRAPGEVQIGTDARWAVRVSGLTAEQVDRLVTVGDRALDSWLPREMLDRLAGAGLLRVPRPRAARVRAELEPEFLGYGLTDPAGDGVPVLRGRARAVVGVVGLDRVGMTVASTLAASGIGTLVVDDAAPVRATDLAAGATQRYLGLPRAQAAADLLRRQAPQVHVRQPGDTSPDIVVSVSIDAVDPGTALDLLTADVAHLPVIVREADAVVGPFVLPTASGDGSAPCMRCLDLHRAELDPAWPTVLAQFTARRRPAVPGPSAALATVAGGLAAAEVLTVVDGRVPRTRGAQYEVPLPDLEPRLRRPGHLTRSASGRRAGVLPGPAATALDGDDLTADEHLAAPDAPRLLPVESTGEAALADRAGAAQGLRLFDLSGALGEPELRVVRTAGDQTGDESVELLVGDGGRLGGWPGSGTALVDRVEQRREPHDVLLMTCGLSEGAGTRVTSAPPCHQVGEKTKAAESGGLHGLDGSVIDSDDRTSWEGVGGE